MSYIYVARLKQRDGNGRLLRRLGRHKNLQEAMAFAVEKYGKNNVKAVMIAAKELKSDAT